MRYNNDVSVFVITKLLLLLLPHHFLATFLFQWLSQVFSFKVRFSDKFLLHLLCQRRK